MPELPEVEVVCRGLDHHLTGRTMKTVRYSRLHLRLPKPEKQASDLLVGSTIISVARQAKYVVIGLDNGSFLIVHLGMTGRLGLFPAGSPELKHDHGFWLFDNSMELRFNDTRRFGSIQIATSAKELEALFSRIGPDPFSRSFTAKYLHKKAGQRKVAVKNFLMDNHIVPGIGNIYASETLFAANIHPARAVSTLSFDEWDKVVRKSRRILKKAIESGGTTISDYVNSSGEKGYFQVKLLVYGRNGEPCRKCDQSIQRSVIGGRASFFCPECQKIG